MHSCFFFVFYLNLAIVENSHGTQITVLGHPTRTIHQVLSAQAAGQLTTQYSYIPSGSAMLGFYSLQGVDLDLMQNGANLQR